MTSNIREIALDTVERWNRNKIKILDTNPFLVINFSDRFELPIIPPPQNQPEIWTKVSENQRKRPIFPPINHQRHWNRVNGRDITLGQLSIRGSFEANSNESVARFARELETRHVNFRCFRVNRR